MTGNFLLRGMLAGLLAGILAFGFAKVFGEPSVDQAVLGLVFGWLAQGPVLAPLNQYNARLQS